MDLKLQDESPAKSSPPSALNEPQANLKNCLVGLQRNGEKGLQEALDQIYPPTALKRVRFLTSSHAQVLTNPPPQPTEKYDPEKHGM